VVTSENGWSAFPVGAGERAARAEGVVAATSIRSDRGLVGTTQANVNAVDPRTLSGLYRFSWTQGSDRALSRLNGNGAVVKEAFARKLHLATGDAFTLRAPNGRSIRLVVAGIYQPPRVGEVLGGVVLGQRAFDRVFPRPQNGLTLVRGSSAAALERALGAFPATKVQTRADYVTSQTSFIGSILNILYVMLALSVVVSLFGMVNTLALSVIERTRELGMLRVVGLSRRQARRMVRHESVITALIGAGLGLPLGTLLAAGVTHALGRYGVAFALPVGSLLAFAAVAFVCGVLAAVAPARRAARLDVLRALQYE
jgi:putative ABC transport system permease protein